MTEKVKYSGNNLSLRYFVHHKSNIRQFLFRNGVPAVCVRRLAISATTRQREFLRYY